MDDWDWNVYTRPRLPPISGPKLKRFGESHSAPAIQYLELVHDADVDSAGRLPHSYVFRVRIGGRSFALKIFLFYDVATARAQLIPEMDAALSDETIVGHADPFYAECRAYGKINSRTRKRPVAVACHGFIGIPASCEKLLYDDFGILEWGRNSEEYDLPIPERRPLRALVKDFVEKDPPLTDPIIKTMLQELRALHRMRVYVMDVKLDNYKGGHLVDLSAAWTEPNFMLDPRFVSGLSVLRHKSGDFYDFDAMLEKANIKTKIKARVATIEGRKRYDFRK